MQKNELDQLQASLQAIEQIMTSLVRLKDDLECIYMDIFSNFMPQKD